MDQCISGMQMKIQILIALMENFIDSVGTVFGENLYYQRVKLVIL